MEYISVLVKDKNGNIVERIKYVSGEDEEC